MSEERFDRVDQRLDEVDTHLKRLDAHLERVDAHLERVDAHLERVDGHLERVDIRFDRLESRVDDLDRHMHVLHEDVIARIAAIPEYNGPTKAEMAAGFAELREMIGRRLDPLEAVVRQHSIEIERLKHRNA